VRKASITYCGSCQNSQLGHVLLRMRYLPGSADPVGKRQIDKRYSQPLTICRCEFSYGWPNCPSVCQQLQKTDTYPSTLNVLANDPNVFLGFALANPGSSERNVLEFLVIRDRVAGIPLKESVHTRCHLYRRRCEHPHELHMHRAPSLLIHLDLLAWTRSAVPDLMHPLIGGVGKGVVTIWGP
jgi:hypothetical protein